MALARPSPSRLPYDVVCMVIDYLWDQRADLASCSLVCRDWSQPCRSHLFRSLRVHSTHADGDFSAFTEFLASPGGQCIRKHVRQLTLQGGPVWLDSQARPRIPLRLLAELINNHLPSLQGLEFRRVRFESDHMDLTSMGTWPRRTIGKLVFHCDSDQLDHFVNILNLLGIFTDISHLEFRAGPLVWRLVPDGVLKNLCWPGPIKVRSLALIEFPKRWTPVALQAIEQSGSLDGTLDTLTVGFQGYADEVEAILPFVHAAAPCIRRLRFNPIPPGLDVTVDVEQLLELFTLPIDTLTNLRSLVLVMYSHDNPTDVAQVVSIIQFRAYILLLQRCVASGLANVVLDVRKMDYDFALELDWDDMDRQLSEIESLRSVRVDYDRLAGFPVDELEALVPRTVGKGILCPRPAAVSRPLSSGSAAVLDLCTSLVWNQYDEDWTQIPFE